MDVTAESIGSAGIVIPVDFRGNIENGEDNKELKDALQISLSSSSGKQSDIQADNLTINTTNNTTLSGSHIEAENGSISAGKLTEKELVHQGFQIAQRLDDGRDIWGQYGSPTTGLITGEGFWEVFGDVVIGNFFRGLFKLEKRDLTIQDISRIVNLGDFNLKGNMSLSKATHQATISQGIKVEIGEKKNEPKNIFRGESKDATKVEMLNPIYNSNGKFWVKK